MIQDSDKKLFSYVIVYQLDRFSRSRYDSAVYKHRLQKNGVRVLSAKEHITTDPTGILLEALIEANAELYSAELSQKVTRGMLQNVLEEMARRPPAFRLSAGWRSSVGPGAGGCPDDTADLRMVSPRPERSPYHP